MLTHLFERPLPDGLPVFEGAFLIPPFFAINSPPVFLLISEIGSLLGSDFRQLSFVGRGCKTRSSSSQSILVAVSKTWKDSRWMISCIILLPLLGIESVLAESLDFHLDCGDLDPPTKV